MFLVVSPVEEKHFFHFPPTELIISIVTHFKHHFLYIHSIHVKGEVLFKWAKQVPCYIFCSPCEIHQMLAQWPQMATVVSRESVAHFRLQWHRPSWRWMWSKCVFRHDNLRTVYPCSHQMGALSLKSFSEAWMTLVLSQAKMLAPRKKPTSQ